MIAKRREVKNLIPFPKFKKYLADLVQVEERLDYKPGQTIFYQGHNPFGIYVLRSGRIRLFTKNEKGTEKLIQIIGPPNILGEDAFVEGKPFEYSAKAETEVSVSFFSRTSLCLKEKKSVKKKNSKE